MNNELQQLKQWCEESITRTTDRPFDDGRNTAYREVLDKINSLSQPETRPFEFPIPEGWEAVTKEGKEVSQLTEFKVVKDCELAGVIDGNILVWYISGKYSLDDDHRNDLILIREEPKTRTLWMVKDHIANEKSQYGRWYTSLDLANIDGLLESDLIPINVTL